jgi:HEAT repeat protein
VAPLTKALDDENEEVRSRSAYALGQLREVASAAVPTLLKLAKNTSESVSVRTHAVWALGRIGREPALERFNK